MIDLRHGDCLELMKTIPDNSVDSILTDPPYNLGVADWDNFREFASFFSESDRLLKDTGFIAFFGQMPHVLEWINEAYSKFHYLEHIMWAKRIQIPSHRIGRSHESIFVFGKKRKQFYTTKGAFSDVKVPMLYFSLMDIEGIKRKVSFYEAKIAGKNTKPIQHTRSQEEYSRYNFVRDQSETQVNFTNVWSFLPPRMSKKNKSPEHLTAKPVPVMERLIELTTESGMLVLDPFAGSGTTAIACQNLRRNFIGFELDKGCFEIATKRIQENAELLERSLF